MTLLESLKSILLPGHTLTIKALSKDSYFRDYNKINKQSHLAYKKGGLCVGSLRKCFPHFRRKLRTGYHLK